MIKIVFGVEETGLRLDAVLASYYPKLGLRGRKRLVARAFLNGRPAVASTRVKPGDTLTIQENTAAYPSAGLIAVETPFFFLFKPSGLHTASLAGSDQPSLEDQLPALLPAGLASESRLLQRLDYDTCGIVAGSFNGAGEKLFRQAEAGGECEKQYLALLSGQLDKPLCVKNKLDTDSRKKTRVLASAASSERWTQIRPLWRTMEGTWALCRIKRGQRHQIRAHAAFCGFPLVGDRLYAGDKGKFCLRHFFIRFGKIAQFDLQGWPGCFSLPQGAAEGLLREIDNWQ